MVTRGLVFAAVTFVAVSAGAKEEPPHLDIGFGTSFPVFIGGQAVIELPGRILLAGEIGWMPEGYVRTINTVAEAYDAYDDTTGNIIRNSLRNSLILRPSIGWRPFAHAGLEIMAGYTRMSLGSGVSARDLVEAITGQDLSNVDADVNIPLRTTMNAFHASIGWRWRLTDHLVLRANVGYLQAFSSNTSIRIDVPPALQDELAALNRAIDAYVDNITKSYIKTPTASLFLSFRF